MMSSFINVRQIKQFDGMNIHTWKIQTEMVLLNVDLYEDVDGLEV